MKKVAGDIIILHMSTKYHNIWRTVSEIWTETDRIFCHSLWTTFCPFTSPSPPHTSLMIPKIKILKNKRKKCLQILSFYTYMCTISEDHMIYGSWNIRCNRQKVLSFQVIFSFQPLDNLENQNFNTEKNTWKYYHFIYLHHMWQSYRVWYLRYRAQQT